MLKLTFALLLVAAAASGSHATKENHREKFLENNSVEVDVPKDPEFCDNREDGLYVTGCSQKFTRCYNKATYSVECPHNLYYDYLRGQCEYKETVKECQNEKLYRNKVLMTPPDFVCGNRTNGLYARKELPCDRQFFSCDNGFARKMSCPDRQYFDEGKQRCEFPNKVSACKSLRLKANGYMPEPPAGQEAVAVPYGSMPGDAPPAAPLPEDIKAVEVKIEEGEQTVDCHRVGDGVYAALTKCSSHFFKCANDRIFKYDCQKNLYYDSEITRCDHKEFIPECGGTRPATTPAPENSAPVMIEFDCTGKADGYHTKATCASEFFSCVGGVANGQSNCPGELVYDIRVNRCDYPEQCKCDRTTPEPPVIGAHGNSVPSENKPVAAVTLPPFDFDCSGKTDGLYPTAKCVKEYAVCSSEVAHRYECQAGLVFDDTTGACDYKDACIIVKTTKPATVAPVVFVTSAPAESQPVATGYGIPSDNEPIRPQIQTYPVSYGGAPVEPETPAPPPVKNPYLPPVETTTKPAPVVATKPVRPPVSNDFCTTKSNGDHPWKSCSPEYVSCWDGIATRQVCYHSLYFNPENGQCDYKENIEGCTGIKKIRPTTTTAAPVITPPAPVQVVSGYGAPIQQDRPVTATTTTTTITAAPIPRNTFCDNKVDGTYSNGCKSYFYVCIERTTRKMHCGGQLFYNAAERKCDHKELVPECGATTTTTTTTQATPVQTPGGYGFPSQDKPSVAVEKPYPFCERLEDGSYGEGCATHYYTCVDRNTYRMSCPGGLYYSVGVHRCDLKENIDECGGTTPKTTTPAPQVINTPVAPVNPYEREPVETPAVPTKPTKATFDCSGKKDGLYDLPECSGSFIQCYQGIKHEQECTGGLYYNVANGMCDYKENVPACGGSLSTTTIAPATKPQPPVYEQPSLVAPATGPYGGVVVQPSSPAPHNQTKPNFNCANQKDGFYSTGCSRRYYSCSNGATTEHICPTTNIRFSQELMRCDIPDNVPECGGTAPTVPPTPEGAGAQPQQPEIPRFDCSKLADGYYAFKTCSSAYVVCQSGNALFGNCQNGLIYDLSAGQCQYKENVADCNPQQTQPTPAPTMPAQPPVAVLPPKSKDKCANLNDGHYVISACANSFMICKDRVSSTQFCPQGQIVNHKTGRCDQPQNIPACAPPVSPVQPGYGAQTPVVQQTNYGYQTPVAQQPIYGYQPQPNYAPPAQTGYGMSEQVAPAQQPYGSGPVVAPAQQPYGSGPAVVPAQQPYSYQQQWRPQGYGK